MRRRRADLAGRARAILTAAQDAGQDMSGDEEQEFDRLMDEADALDKQIAREQRVRDQERVIETDPEQRQESNGPDDSGDNGDDAQQRAFRAYLVGGRANLTPDQSRVLNMGNDPEGGYLVAPQQFVEQLIQAVDDAVPLRPLATVMTLTEGESLGVPALDTDLNDADWTSELATGSQDDSLRIGKRELRPHPLAKRVKVSRTLLRRATLGPEEIVRDRMAYKFAVTEEKAFMSGTGSQRPLGLFTASSQGVSTARDVTTGAANAFSADGLIDAKYTLKPQYWRRARWLFHRDSIRGIRKLKDANNQYLWQPGLAGDRPDTIVDVPYVVSEFVPNTITDGNYVGMIADFSYYWVVDTLAFEVQRLVELYAESNQVGFIGRAEVDAMPVLEEAFVRIQVGA